jgi:hypothetical protein
MKEIKFKIITLLLSIFLVGIFYGDILVHPNDFLFSESGDGIKNYYTAHYFVKHDGIGFNTHGLNYPYGELISFTDNQPSISWSIQLLKKLGIDLSDNVIGVFNLLMLLSICIASLFYYLIARRIYLPPYYAVLVALLISFLSPQVERFTGHYALGYVCFVPMLWYLLIRAFEKNFSIRYGLLIALYNLFFGFIHPYYVLIGTLFCVVYAICNYAYSPKNLKALLAQLVLFASSPILLQFILNAKDSVIDRPSNPWGLLDYATRIEGVFLPVNSLLLDLLNKIIKVRSTDIETHSYVGLVATMVFVFSLIKFFKYIKRKKFKYIVKPILPAALRTALLTAVLLLLFAMAIPFRIGLTFILDWVPAIKQFRSLGRFAWIFYSVFAMYSSFYLYLLYKKWSMQGRKKFAYVFVFICLLIWASESYNANSYTNRIIANRSSEKYYSSNVKEKLKELNVNLSEFQAILPIPIYLIGSEVIGIHNDETGIVFQSMKISAQTGLPIGSTMLSRTSLSQTIKLASFVSDSLLSKENYLKDINSKKFLLISKKQELTEAEQELLVLSTFLFTDELGFNYYTLDPLRIKEKNYKIDGTEFIANKEGKNILGKHDWYYWQSYGEGKFFTKENSELYKGDVWGDGNYECSFWLKLSNKHIAPRLVFESFDKTNNLIEKKSFDCGVFSNVDGNWLRVENRFSYSEKEGSIRFSLITQGDTIKNLLIKPQNIKVITSKPTEKRINNFTF